jgi:hypothetical protein
VFGIVVAVTVQSTFRLEMYQNKKKIHFLKIIFDNNASKRSENIYFFILNKKIQNLRKRGLHLVSKHIR